MRPATVQATLGGPDQGGDELNRIWTALLGSLSEGLQVSLQSPGQLEERGVVALKTFLAQPKEDVCPQRRVIPNVVHIEEEDVAEGADGVDVDELILQQPQLFQLLRGSLCGRDCHLLGCKGLDAAHANAVEVARTSFDLGSSGGGAVRVGCGYALVQDLQRVCVCVEQLSHFTVETGRVHMLLRRQASRGLILDHEDAIG
mmetsp:Transcript_15302/g.45322  ORF Transcript_15302/g.45322 Transcript_15302/m.45322 type:complete len:201 (+) Transcript_15302:2189-2791(+)